MDRFLPIFFAALLGGVLIYFVVIGAAKRRKALEEVALRLGLRFDPRPDRALHRTFRHSLFDKGRSRRASNNFYGTLEIDGHSIDVRMGDYQYVTGHGKHRRTHRFSFACFLLPFVGTPDLLLRKENLGDKLMGGLGFDDIDFESDEFNRRFWVKSGDKRFAYDVIHPRMMEFLLKGPTPQFEIVGDVCLVREGWGLWDPDTFEGAPGWFGAFLQRWPEHLTSQLQTRQGKFA